MIRIRYSYRSRSDINYHYEDFGSFSSCLELFDRLYDILDSYCSHNIIAMAIVINDIPLLEVNFADD